MKIARCLIWTILIGSGLLASPVAHGAEMLTLMHPDANARLDKIKTIGIVSPNVEIYEVSAGEIKELRDDWSARGKETVIQEIARTLEGRHWKIKVLKTEEPLREEIEEIQALYETVLGCIYMHVYGYYFTFPEKKTIFDYSVGSTEKILKRYGVDAILLVYGVDEISSSGRKAVMTTRVVVGVLMGVPLIPRSGMTYGSIALVDRTGALLWFNTRLAEGTLDLREPADVSTLINKILTDFPGHQK